MAIHYGKQFIDQDDIQEVVNTLTSDFLTQGPKVEEFEKNFAEKVNAPHAIAVSNGTTGLHLACVALGVDSKSVVLTTPNTFAATSNAVLYCSGKVEFVDIEAKSFLIDVDLLEQKLKADPKKYSGIITVDFAGHPSPMKRLRVLADRYGLWLLRDACHSLGGVSEGEALADISVYSFHPVKHITTGEGGMLTTRNEALAKKMRILRTHGITKNTADYKFSGQPVWYHEMQALGFNYRICDIQAALGNSQLKKLDLFMKRRFEIAREYDSFFDSLGIQHQAPHAGHAYHLYVIQHPKRDAIYSFLRERGIFGQVHYIPVVNHPYYRELGYRPEDYPVAQKYYQQTLSLPMYYSLSSNELESVKAAIREFVQKESK